MTESLVISIIALCIAVCLVIAYCVKNKRQYKKPTTDVNLSIVQARIDRYWRSISAVHAEDYRLASWATSQLASEEPDIVNLLAEANTHAIALVIKMIEGQVVAIADELLEVTDTIDRLERKQVIARAKGGSVFIGVRDIDVVVDDKGLQRVIEEYNKRKEELEGRLTETEKKLKTLTNGVNQNTERFSAQTDQPKPPTSTPTIIGD